MNLADFDYQLPPELIAKRPPEKRRDARLLVAGPDVFDDLEFVQLPSLLSPGDLLVLNDTKVINARLFGTKETGGRVEILVERILEQNQASECVAQIKASKPLKPGARIKVSGEHEMRVVARQADGFYQLSSKDPVSSLLSQVGEVPLPPYLERSPDTQDSDRYQTVYASTPGAVAAPTAGLHFDEEMLGTIREIGIEIGFVTLHVGAGTFQPVRVEDIRQHQMHRETVIVDSALCEKIARARGDKKRVCAIGTTTTRALETMGQAAITTGEKISPYSGESELFIYPGFEFRIVDALLTNFHLPRSTLLMMVSAFAGYKRIMRAYEHAVKQRYRFFSYGDAMWLTRDAS